MMHDEKEFTIEVTEEWEKSTAAYRIVTDGDEIYGNYNLRSEEWLRDVTAELSEDGSLPVVTAVVELDELPRSSW